MTKHNIQAIRGMRDILPTQTTWWHRMEDQLLSVLKLYGYKEIRTPILEKTALFSRSIGEQTDIVSKEMYTFTDRDGSSLTMRPEGTASVVRAFVEHNLIRAEPVNRLFYMGPMFRHERPQKGRYRQFYQMGAELLGSADPAADVELMELMVRCISSVGLDDTSLHINSLGCSECRPAYREKLVEYLKKHEQRLCDDCKRRLETNPLRVLDCKKDACISVSQKAPHMMDFLCHDCSEHFETVRAGLSALDLQYELDHRMVRGLDYYGRTTFELIAKGLGAQNAVAAGGRYDGLVKQIGGPDVPAVGFASGLDRILLLLQEQLQQPKAMPVLFLVTHGNEAWLEGLKISAMLRRDGFKVMTDVRRGSMKSQMKRADKDGARFVLIVGDDELSSGQVTVKDMVATPGSAKQISVPSDELSTWLRARLGDGKGQSR